MMGKWTRRETVMCVAAVIISWSIVYIVAFRSGQNAQKLSANQTQIVQQDSVVRRDSLRVDTSHKASDSLLTRRATIRERVRVVRDSVFVRDTVYVDSTLAQLVTTDDSVPPALVKERADHAALVASLYGTIALRDRRIALLESQHNPRISRGIQVGVGVCQPLSGERVPCGYIGYGFQFRLP